MRRLEISSLREFRLRLLRGIAIHEEAYVKGMKEVANDRDRAGDEPLQWKEQTAYRSWQGALSWSVQRSRPDANCEVNMAASKNIDANLQELRELNKILKYLKSTISTKIFYPMMPGGSDEEKKFRLLGLSDAALMNAEDGKSQGGCLIWLCEDMDSQNRSIVAHLIHWDSKKIDRVTRSSLASETYKVQDMTSVMEFINTMLKEMYGQEFPADARTDSESLIPHLSTSKRPRDLRLYGAIAQLRQDLEEKRLRNMKHVPDVDNITDCLTKKNVPKKKKERLRAALCNGMITKMH
jgi:hypothetical protein